MSVASSPDVAVISIDHYFDCESNDSNRQLESKKRDLALTEKIYPANDFQTAATVSSYSVDSMSTPGFQPYSHLIKEDVPLFRRISTGFRGMLQSCYSPWAQTIHDVNRVRALRNKLKYEGYPHSRIVMNQIGDGLLGAAVAGVAVAAASANPLFAGVIVWAVRAVEYTIAVVWNQHMSSERRLARLAAQGDEVQQKETAKLRASREIVSSTRYDAVGAAATIGAVAVAILGGPLVAIILLGVVFAATQTISKFKEGAWSALRYVISPHDDVQKEMLDLQEPMNAYEMAINIGVMTLAYVAAFAAITAFYIFLPHVALPVTAVLAVTGAVLMISAKYNFRQEQGDAEASLQRLQQQAEAEDKLQQALEDHCRSDTEIAATYQNLVRRKKSVEQIVAELATQRNAHGFDCVEPYEDALAKLEGIVNTTEDEMNRILGGFLSLKKPEQDAIQAWDLQEISMVFNTVFPEQTMSQETLNAFIKQQVNIAEIYRF